MKAIQRILIVFVAIMMFLSCNCRHKKTASVLDDNATVISIPVLKDTIIRFSDFCSNVELVPLESTPLSALEQIDGLSISNQGDYIVYDRILNKLLRFDNNGSFVNQIGQPGHQDHEYSAIADYAYDSFEDQVIIMDLEKRILLFYALDGKFIKCSELMSGVLNFDVLDKDHLVFWKHKMPETHLLGMHYKNYSYSYVVTSKDGNSIVREYEDSGSILKRSEGVWSTDLSAFDNVSAIGHSVYSPDVYRITADTLYHCFHLSFADKTISKEWSKYDEDTFQSWITPDVAYCSDIFVTDHYYLIDVSKGPIHLFVQERTENGNAYSGFFKINDMYGKEILDTPWWHGVIYSPIYARDETCYFAIYPRSFSSERIMDARKQLLSSDNEPKMKDHILEMLNRFDYMIDKGNPILIKCTLK